MSQFAGLGIVIALPGELSDGGKTQVDVNEGKAVESATHPVEQVMAEVESVHQRPGIVGLGPNDFLGNISVLARITGSAGNSTRLYRQVKISTTVINPTPVGAVPQDKRNAQWRVLFGEI